MKAVPSIRVSLLVRICIVILVISLAAAGLASWLGYDHYFDAVTELNTEEVQNIAGILAGSIDTASWRLIAGAADGEARTSEAYVRVQKCLRQLTDSFGLANVCVFAADGKGILTDTGTAQDGTAPCAYTDLLAEVISTGKAGTHTEVLKDRSVLVTVYMPITDENGCAAVVGMSRGIGGMDDFLSAFYVRALLAGLGMALALCALAILEFWLRIVRPLQLIRREAEQFISNHTRVSEKLAKVRTHDEIQSLAESFLKMERDIDRYVEEVGRASAEKERISTELSIAARIQADMLPRVFPPYPDRPEFDLYASMKPAREVGGDFYDFFFTDKDHLALVVGDVSGKGVPAALFMVITKTLIRTRTLAGGTPSEILKDVNAQLCEGNDADMFATVWLAMIDVRTGRGVAANAGHEDPALCSGGAYELVKTQHSPVVAALDTAVFREHEFELHPGDRLFIYSDGLPEAMDENGEMYGTTRMLGALDKGSDLPLSGLLTAVTDDMEAFTGGAQQSDDVTMLTFEYKGNR